MSRLHRWSADCINGPAPARGGPGGGGGRGREPLAPPARRGGGGGGDRSRNALGLPDRLVAQRAEACSPDLLAPGPLGPPLVAHLGAAHGGLDAGIVAAGLSRQVHQQVAGEVRAHATVGHTALLRAGVDRAEFTEVNVPLRGAVRRQHIVPGAALPVDAADPGEVLRRNLTRRLHRPHLFGFSLALAAPVPIGPSEYLAAICVTGSRQAAGSR